MKNITSLRIALKTRLNGLYALLQQKKKCDEIRENAITANLIYNQ